MHKYVIDTNVAIVANGTDEAVCVNCRLACVKLLQKALKEGLIYLDSGLEIQNEYRRHLNPNGEPGVGDRFYQQILQFHPDKIAMVDVAKNANGEFVDVPQALIDAGFDPSDRKFVAVARKAKSKIYNAVDTDWLEQRTVLEEQSINVVFICGADPATWRHGD